MAPQISSPPPTSATVNDELLSQLLNPASSLIAYDRLTPVAAALLDTDPETALIEYLAFVLEPLGLGEADIMPLITGDAPQPLSVAVATLLGLLGLVSRTAGTPNFDATVLLDADLDGSGEASVFYTLPTDATVGVGVLLVQYTSATGCSVALLGGDAPFWTTALVSGSGCSSFAWPVQPGLEDTLEVSCPGASSGHVTVSLTFAR